MLSALILFIICTVAIFPAVYLPSVTKGFILFYSAVLPALFPFFFFTRLLSGLGFPEATGKLFEKPVRKLYNAPPISSYIMFMSLLSGYPVGAKLILDCYRNNIINTDDCKKIISFSSTSAPIFVIGTVATFMLDKPAYGALILTAHYLSALFTGLIFCRIGKGTDGVAISALPPKNHSDNILGDSINDAVISILSVGGLIAVFSVIIDIFSDIGLYRIFGDKASPVLIGLTEMTRGCQEIAKSSLSTPLTLAVITGLISFGGLCIIVQSMAFLAPTGVKSSYFIAVKVTQGIFGFVTAYVLGLAFASVF